jgi:hypothetical protein
MENFSQLCVWEGTVVGADEVANFEGWLQSEFGVRAKYVEEVLTLPTEGEPETGGRNDLFFRVHDEDVMKFAVPRLMVGIKWWEDVLGNGNGVLYPQEVLEKYEKTW